MRHLLRKSEMDEEEGSAVVRQGKRARALRTRRKKTVGLSRVGGWIDRVRRQGRWRRKAKLALAGVAKRHNEEAARQR